MTVQNAFFILMAFGLLILALMSARRKWHEHYRNN
jgi:hypothetical protein